MFTLAAKGSCSRYVSKSQKKFKRPAHVMTMTTVSMRQTTDSRKNRRDGAAINSRPLNLEDYDENQQGTHYPCGYEV